MATAAGAPPPSDPPAIDHVPEGAADGGPPPEVAFADPVDLIDPPDADPAGGDPLDADPADADPADGDPADGHPADPAAGRAGQAGVPEAGEPEGAGEPEVPAGATVDPAASLAALALAPVPQALPAWRATIEASSPPGTLLGPGDVVAAGLEVTQAHPSGLAKLYAGGPVGLSALVRDGQLLGEARRRVRRLRAAADRLTVDRGLASSAFAVGLLTWRPSPRAEAPAPAPLRAPVLLRPCALRPRGEGHDDHEVQLADVALLNPELVRVLARDEGVVLDADALGALAFGPRGFDPQPVYALLAELCADLRGFTVEHRLWLGSFTPGPDARLTDLDRAAPLLAAHPVFGAPPTPPAVIEESAAGSAGERSGSGDPDRDEVAVRPVRGVERDAARDLAVLDLDPAQRRAVDAVLAGGNVAVEGPPGSGSTQTLVAAAAQLVAQGKRVLLVTPHRATADAFLARLDEAGLGSLALDLHDGAGDRSRLLAALAGLLDSTISGGRAEATRAAVDATAPAVDRVRRVRASLAAAVEALHAAREPWGVSAYQAMAALADLMSGDAAPRTKVRLRHDVTRRLDTATREALRADLHEAAQLGVFDLSRRDTRWVDAALPTLESAERALAVARSGRRDLVEARTAMAAVSAVAGLREAATVGEWRPQLDLLLGVRDTLDVMLPAVFEQPLDELIAITEPGSGSGVSRRARRLLRRRAEDLVRPGVHVADLHGVLERAHEQRRRWRSLAPAGGWPRVPTGLAAADAAVGAVEAALEVLQAALTAQVAGDLRVLSLDELAALLADLAQDEVGAREQPRRAELLDRLRSSGLSELLDDLQERRCGPDEVDGELDLAWWTSVLETIIAGDPRLARHDRSALPSRTEELRTAEAQLASHARARVLAAAATAARAALARHPDQARWLRAEAYRGHRSQWPVDLFRRAPAVVGALLPIWVMSPEAVSRLLPLPSPSDPAPGTGTTPEAGDSGALVDVVMVDDAGQVGVADAAGAVARGRSVVVAGDRRRLPPASGDPSVLEAVASRAGVLRLDRDHRARDGRLLAPVRHAYPEGWAAVTGAAARSPLEFEHVADGVAVPGPGQEIAQSADAEVRRVVNLVADHASRRPGESLLVVTLGQRHAERIEEALRAEAFTHPDLERWLAVHWRGEISEPFLVRPVHRIAGLERDATIVSIGLARTPHGRVLHRFGVLDGRHGRACLLAALSRARRRTTLVCCFTADDLAAWRVRSEGARTLHRVLAVAADPQARGDRSAPARPGPTAGQEDADQEDATRQERREESAGPEGAGQEGAGQPGSGAQPRGPEPDPLVADLRDRLAAAGLPVAPPVDGPDRPVDLVLADPSEPGRLLLAVDVDGPGHADLPGVRLRERQRRESFERAGWTYLRVAAMDLFCDPGAEVERVRGAWQAAGGLMATPTPATGLIIGRPRPRVPRPAVPPGRPIGAYRADDLDAMARWVLSDGVPRDSQQLTAQVCEALHLVRRGGRVDAVVGASAARVLAAEAAAPAPV